MPLFLLLAVQHAGEAFWTLNVTGGWRSISTARLGCLVQARLTRGSAPPLLTMLQALSLLQVW